MLMPFALLIEQKEKLREMRVTSQRRTVQSVSAVRMAETSLSSSEICSVLQTQVLGMNFAKFSDEKQKGVSECGLFR
jgi:hypothetical protein